MSNQVAKMYLRGSLCNKIMKELSYEQRQEVEELIESVIEDPLLQPCRMEFKNALARTIKNEYVDLEVGEQDYRIAVMRAAVAAKFGANKPEPYTLTDPIQRKKWFQTWVFNYLRQILRENKVPSTNTFNKISVSADSAALHEVNVLIAAVIKKEHNHLYRKTLREIWERVHVTDREDGYDIQFEHWCFPINLLHGVIGLNDVYLKSGVEITQVEDGIKIRHTGIQQVTVTKCNNTIVHETSFDATDETEDDNSKRGILEMRIINNRNQAEIIDEEDIITKLKNNLPYDAHKVLDILMEDTRPDDYTEKYGQGSPKIVHMAEYLNKSAKEIKNTMKKIQTHCMALGIGQR